jgi:enamine deaminase RidA (YjgF/YER057c/UK114 family)
MASVQERMIDMNKVIETKNAPPAFSSYAQAVEVRASVRTVHVSGQVGVSVSGDLPDDAEKEHELAWKNVFAVLEAADMTGSDIVDVVAIVTDHAQVPIYRKIRDRMLGGHLCASTMLVCGLANPAWKVEIAVKAAKAE